MPEYEAATGYIQLVPSARGFSGKAQGELSRINLDKTVDLDVDAAKLDAKVAAARAKLESLQRQKADPRIDADIVAVTTKITQVRARLDELGRKKADPKVDADVAAAQANLTRLTARLDELNRKRADPKVDADIAVAEAELARAGRAVDALDRKRAQLRVDADTTAASAKLDEVDRKASSLSGKRATVNVGENGGGRVTAIISAIIAGLSAIASLAGPAAAALAAIPAALSGAAQGIGAVLAGFSGVSKAITGVEAAQKSASSSGTSGAKAQQSAMNGVESAARSLQQAQIQQGRTAIQGAQQVAAAVRSLEAAQIQADRAAITGAQQVAAARRALAQAQIQAARSVEDAERSYTRALQSERYAQEALTTARKDAQRALEDLKLATSGAALSQERAQINLERARQRLAAANAAGMPEGLDKQEITLDVREAEQSLKEVQNRYKNLKEDSADWARTGVEGSAQVVAAQRSLQAAQDSTRDSARQLARAQADGARSVQDAQIALGQAVQQAGWAQQDAARGVRDAEIALAQARQQADWANQDAARGVADAQRALAQAYQQAGDAGTAGANKVADALAGLSPAAAAFVLFWVNEFKPQLKQVSDAVAAEMLPRITTALRKTTELIPIFRDGLAETGRVVGDLAIQGANLVTSGPWKADFATILASNNRSMTSYGQAGLSLADAFRSITVAALPMLERFARAVKVGADLFNTWIQGKRNSGELTAWFGQMGDRLSGLWDVVKSLATGLFELWRALSPVGDILIAELPVIRDVAVALGQGIGEGLKIVLPLIKPLVDLVGALARGFSALPQPLQGTIGALGLLAFFGPKVASGLLGIGGAIGNAGTALALFVRGRWGEALSALAGPARTAGTNAGRAIGDGVAAGGATAATKAEGVGGAAAEGASRGWRSKFSRFIGGAAIFAVAVAIADEVLPDQLKLSKAIPALVDQLNSAFTGEKLSPATQQWQAWWNRASNTVRDHLGLARRFTDDGMNQINTGILEGSTRGVAAFNNGFRPMPQDAKTAADQTMRNLLTPLQQQGPPLLNVAGNGLVTALLGPMQRLPPMAGQAGQGATGALGAGLAPAPGVAGAAGAGAAGALGQGLAPMPGGAFANADATTKGLAGGLLPMPGQAGGAGQGATGGMLGGLSGMAPGASRAGQDTTRGLQGAVAPLPGAMGQAGSAAGSGFFDNLRRVWDSMMGWLGGAVSNLMSWLGSVSQSIANTLGYGAVRSGLGFAQGGLIAPMAAGGVLEQRPVVANAAGNGLTPMSGQRATVVPANTLRIIGDNMRYSELFAPLDGSERTRRLLALGAAHEGFALVAQAAISGMADGRREQQEIRPVGRYAVGAVIRPGPVHRYDTAARVTARATTAPAAGDGQAPLIGEYHQYLGDGGVTAGDALDQVAYKTRVWRRGGAHR